MKTPWNTVLVASSLAAFALGAAAQMPPPVDDHAGMSQMHHGRPMSPERMEARLNQHLSELKQKLHITASQEPAWTTFAAAMKPPSKLFAAMPERAEMEKLTTPERIDKMKQIRIQHQEAAKPYMDQRDEAIKNLYATLDAPQKKTFDAEHARMMKRRNLDN